MQYRNGEIGLGYRASRTGRCRAAASRQRSMQTTLECQRTKCAVHATAHLQDSPAAGPRPLHAPQGTNVQEATTRQNAVKARFVPRDPRQQKLVKHRLDDFALQDPRLKRAPCAPQASIVRGEVQRRCPVLSSQAFSAALDQRQLYLGSLAPWATGVQGLAPNRLLRAQALSCKSRHRQPLLPM